MFAGFYSGRRVLVTGHTGFKGSWLATWLSDLGAAVVGYSLEPPSEPSHFVTCQVARLLAADVRGDVRDAHHFQATLERHRPEVVFHLAAQSLVGRGFAEPGLTFDVNVVGTVNVLEAARAADVGVTLCVTSDKCYRNDGPGPRVEEDPLGGSDPYSTSKAAAELVVALYQSPAFRERYQMRMAVASARAGNALGGGDWGTDRLFPDAVRALSSGQPLVVRKPGGTRPWQHVLEPLSGYLWLAVRALTEPTRRRAYNFGPPVDEPVLTVREVVAEIERRWPARLEVHTDEALARGEAPALRIDPSRARTELGWRTVWTAEAAIGATVEWYRAVHAGAVDPLQLTLDQVRRYASDARGNGLSWTAA